MKTSFQQLISTLGHFLAFTTPGSGVRRHTGQGSCLWSRAFLGSCCPHAAFLQEKPDLALLSVTCLPLRYILILCREEINLDFFLFLAENHLQ